MCIRDSLFNVGDFLNFVVENYGKTVSNMRGGEVVETLPTLARQLEAYIGLAVLVGAGLRIPQVFSPDRGNARYEIPGLVA